MSDKALKDYAYRVMMQSKDDLPPGTTDLELHYFVNQLDHFKLTQIYGMFFETGMVL